MIKHSIQILKFIECTPFCFMAAFWGEVCGGAHLHWNRFAPPLRIFAPLLERHAPPLEEVWMIDQSEKLTFFGWLQVSRAMDLKGHSAGVYHFSFSSNCTRCVFLRYLPFLHLQTQDSHLVNTMCLQKAYSNLINKL
jgi:hypothetical protein